VVRLVEQFVSFQFLLTGDLANCEILNAMYKPEIDVTIGFPLKKICVQKFSRRVGVEDSASTLVWFFQQKSYFGLFKKVVLFWSGFVAKVLFLLWGMLLQDTCQ